MVNRPLLSSILCPGHSRKVERIGIVAVTKILEAHHRAYKRVYC
jgi:hypothetical protein